MLFTHDTEMALRGAAALINTAATLPTDTDDLPELVEPVDEQAALAEAASIAATWRIREASRLRIMSAIISFTSWCSPMGTPKVLRLVA